MSRTEMLAFASMAMVCWAFWAILSERAIRSIAVAPAVTAAFLGGTSVTLVYLLARGDFALDPSGLTPAVLAGMLMAGGMVFYYIALGHGNVGIATTVGALYFLPVTVVGVLFLGEPLDATDVGGILAAAVAIVLFVK